VYTVQYSFVCLNSANYCSFITFIIWIFSILNRPIGTPSLTIKKGLHNLDASDTILDKGLELEELPQLLICPSALYLSLFLLHIRVCWARHLGFRHPTVCCCFRLCAAGQGGLMQRRLLKPTFLLPGLFLF
jgi:hypothetical protein